MHNLVVSKYTCLFKSNSSSSVEYLVYNSMANSFVEISGELYKTLSLHKENPNDNNLSEISEDCLRVLNKNKILVQLHEDDSFIRSFELQTHLRNLASSHLNLSLVPTSACNFACPYCYEKSKPNLVMDDKTISDLTSFINAHKNIKTIGITWYGGEPLVAFGTIKKIVAKIETECSAKLTNQSMVTNGYNFTSEVISFFKRYNFERVQITVDGPEDEHNKTRILKNGKGSYKKIMSNIENIVRELPNTFLAIRVNIGKNNQKGFSVLYKELKNKYSNRITIYPGFIRINNEDNTCLTCGSMEQRDMVDFYNNLDSSGDLKVNYYPKIVREKGCVATSSTAYVIGPLGEIYKCWNDLGEKDLVVGHISDRRLTNSDLYNKYMVDGQWMSDGECRSCFFLPICNGGCAWHRVRNKHYSGKYDFCNVYKEKGIEYFLQIQYRKWKEKKQN